MSDNAARQHALLSASGAGLWLECPASARLNDCFLDEESEFSAEGTVAHKLADLELRQYIAKIKGKEAPPAPPSGEYTAEMVSAVQHYIEVIDAIVSPLVEAKRPYVILAETQVDFSRWVPDGFGTSDCIVISEEKIWVVDFKYGKGIEVYAEGNPQCSLYALGAFDLASFFFEQIGMVEAVIVQPRRGHVDRWEQTTEALLEWAYGVIPRARSAYICFDPKPDDFRPGAHCNRYFCNARFTCRARSEWAISVAKSKGLLLQDDQIAALLPDLPGLEKWAKDVQAYALDRATSQGVRFPGMKLVEGRSNRYITDQIKAEQLLIAEGYPLTDIRKEPELRGITELQKLVGKATFESLLADLLAKPKGKPALVPESDPRKAWTPAVSADEEFE